MVRQIRDLEGRLRAAGQQRPISWLPDVGEFLTALLQIEDLNSFLKAIEDNAADAAQLTATIQNFNVQSWFNGKVELVRSKIIAQFQAITAPATIDTIRATIEAKCHKFEQWQKTVLDHEAALKKLIAELDQKFNASSNVNTLKTTVVAVIDGYFTAPVRARLAALKTEFINGGAIIDHEAPRERRLVAVQK